MPPLSGVGQDAGVLLADILAGGDEEAGGAAGRVADLVAGLRRGHVDHQPDDVSRRAELAVLARRGDLAEHVLVEVAVGVTVRHGDVREQVDDLRQQGRCRDREPGVLHVLGVGGVVATDLRAVLLQEREDLGADGLEHDVGVEVLEVAPPQVRLTGQERRVLDRATIDTRLLLREHLQVVQAAEEQEVGDLLDHLEGVADPAGPEGVPDAIDLALEVPSDHRQDPTIAPPSGN